MSRTSAASISGSSPKRPSIKTLPILSQSDKPVYYQFLILFFALKCVVFGLAHISIAMVHPNNSASDLIICSAENLNSFDRFLKIFVTPFVRWDGVHFISIAIRGYVFENQFAFFPLLPLTARYSALLLYNYCGLSSFVSFEPLVAFLGILFTNVCHFLATLFLFKLTNLVFKSTKFAMITAIMFLFNPASIQLSAFYTEAPFALFTFVGLYYYYKESEFMAAIFWALASATRSNGIVLIGFFFYGLFNSIFYKKNLSISSCLLKVIKTVLYSAVSVSTLVGFQYYAYTIYCSMDNSSRPWCSARIPSIYSFVQKTYWNVGMFNYFTINQIPNFLVAMPMIIICSTAVFLYFESDHTRFLCLGLTERKNKRAKSLQLFYDDLVLPHIYLLCFMLSYNIFIAHVQIITRLFTFMPVVYWFMAHVIMNLSIKIQKTMLTYIGIYGLLEICLFALNYPPA